MAVARGSAAGMRRELWVWSLKGYPKNMSSGYFLALTELKSWEGWSGQLVFRSQTGGLQATNGLWILV